MSLSEILTAYPRLRMMRADVAEAEIVTARILWTQATRALLEQQVAKLAGGQRVRATYARMLRCWAARWSGSGRRCMTARCEAQLQQLKQRLIAATSVATQNKF